MCSKTNQAGKMALFPSSGIESCEQRWAVWLCGITLQKKLACIYLCIHLQGLSIGDYRNNDTPQKGQEVVKKTLCSEPDVWHLKYIAIC